jgi:hypothetical protein
MRDAGYPQARCTPVLFLTAVLCESGGRSARKCQIWVHVIEGVARDSVM